MYCHLLSNLDVINFLCLNMTQFHVFKIEPDITLQNAKLEKDNVSQKKKYFYIPSEWQKLTQSQAMEMIFLAKWTHYLNEKLLFVNYWSMYVYCSTTKKHIFLHTTFILFENLKICSMTLFWIYFGLISVLTAGKIKIFFKFSSFFFQIVK